MSQMNKGLTSAGKTGPVPGQPLTSKASGTWKNAENKAKTAPGKLQSAQQALTQGKAQKQDGLAMANRAKQNAANLPGWANASNQQNAANKISAGKSQISQAKQDIKANTRTGPTMGANRTPQKVQTVKLGPGQLGAGKLKTQTASLGPGQLGAGKLPQFKQANPSNPMGRMGGKPGVNIGTNKF